MKSGPANFAHAGITMSTNLSNLVTRDPDILGGTPVFAGTRVPIDTLMAHLKAGDSLETFLGDFPSVSRQQAEAALDLAAELLSAE
jgi:uncharacterized protein (DUF433 family)